MSGTRGGVGRIVAMGLALALGLLLLVAAEARAGKYAVAQCGWYVGADAEWADTTGGAKFRPDSYCVPPGSGDPFDGSRLKSFTREGQATVSGTRFARWRWSAPAGTAITQVRGTWWHALRDGMEQRVGGVDAGGFTPFMSAATTDTAPREFVAGFPSPVAAIEDRLLCARAESKWCSLDAPSWGGVRALTITLEDPSAPAVGLGGDVLAVGWRRGVLNVSVAAADGGSGVRFGEVLVDGARTGLTEFPCAKASIGGEWRGTAMRPCTLSVGAWQTIASPALSDGPHSVRACASDFAGNSSCTADRTMLVDNTPPAHPRAIVLAGGDGWRRTNDFDLTWTNPDQGPASPIVGAGWRLTGPAGYDGGASFAAGPGRAGLSDLKLPGPGAFSLALWLRDEAGNEAPAAAAVLPLRLDDVPPGVAFLAAAEPWPALVEAEVSDAHSGPARGEIHYRRAGSEHWVELPTKLVVGPSGPARLRATLPDLEPGNYLFRADVADGAGNTASTGRRADGTEMAIRRAAPVEPERRRTRLYARLGGARGRGELRTVGFGSGGRLSGRLVRVDGAGVEGRELRILSRPSRGALAKPLAATVRTDERGEFELALAPGVSRRITVSFAGDEGLEPSSRRPLELRVRSGVSLRADRTRLTTGQLLRLSGEVRAAGAAIPRRGKLVAIQYFERETRRWRPVVLTRSDHAGRFRARYRFRYVSGVARIRLRATALAEERWPYAPGSSRPLSIEVVGR